LESVLPQMASKEEIVAEMKAKYVFAAAAEDMPKKGEIMKWAKETWGSRADMKLVGAVASELYGV